MTHSLCESCMHMLPVISGTGSRYLLCRLSQTDRHFPKYSPQPVVKCLGYEQAEGLQVERSVEPTEIRRSL